MMPQTAGPFVHIGLALDVAGLPPRASEIGPEIAAATRVVLEAASDRFGLDLAFRVIEVGFAALEATGSTFPETAFKAIEGCDGIVLGPVSHNAYPTREDGGLNPSGELRKRLDLFANIRPARSRA